MKYYWYKLLYALKIKEKPASITSAELINIALAKIGDDSPKEVASDIEKQRGIDALNAMVKDWA